MLWVVQTVFTFVHKSCILLSDPGGHFEMQLLLLQLACDGCETCLNAGGIVGKRHSRLNTAKENKCKLLVFLIYWLLFSWFSLHLQPNQFGTSCGACSCRQSAPLPKRVKMRCCASIRHRQSDAFSFLCSQMRMCSCKEAAHSIETKGNEQVTSPPSPC